MSPTQLVFQSSELSRNSGKVFSAAEKSPILVTRRDGEGFILMSESEAKARKSLLEFASDLIATARASFVTEQPQLAAVELNA